jgi:hypothetical protein
MADIPKSVRINCYANGEVAAQREQFNSIMLQIDASRLPVI